MSRYTFFFFFLSWVFFLAEAQQNLKQSGSSDSPGTVSNKVFEGPDIILYNGKVMTMGITLSGEEAEPVDAVAIQGKYISAIGTNERVLSFQTPSTQLIDLEGRTVVPGLIEGHSHAIQQGFFESGVDGIIQATQRMAADGYTTVHELASNVDFIEVAQRAAASGKLATRINFYILYNDNCNIDRNIWQTFPYTEKKDTVLRLVGVKMFSDGGSCGLRSSLSTLWQDTHDHGDIFRTQEEMNNIVSNVLSAGYPIAFHAVGDTAISIGLGAFEHAIENGLDIRRSRMEHVRGMREDLIDRMADVGIGASIQYTWARSRLAPYFESLVLPESLDGFFSWRKMADKGIPIIGGNDYPIAALRSQAMQSISYLATRKQARNDLVAPWLEGNQLTIKEGLYAMIGNNAWIVFEENVKGAIGSGKLADLTVLSDNPLEVDPYDVRDIKIEMTIMDGVIRHNQFGKMRFATHDAGTFSITVDDRGLWGPERSQLGLQVNGVEQLFQGSLLISYDENTVATATRRQKDYFTDQDGNLVFTEPGQNATEEATAIYHDLSTRHPNSLEIIQHTRMWEGESFLLVDYLLKSHADHTVEDIYVGPFMVFNITSPENEWYSFLDDLGKWEENNGLGFAYMYDENESSPYIGIALFDESRRHVNNMLTFTAGNGVDIGGTEAWFARTMRSGIIEQEAAEPGSYSILSAAGPYTIERGQFISPFKLAIVAGQDLNDLKRAVNRAYGKAYGNILGTEPEFSTSDFQLFPNPFISSATINFSLPETELVTIGVYDLLGQKVKTLLFEERHAGQHQIQLDGKGLEHGAYIIKIETGSYQKELKVLHLSE